MAKIYCVNQNKIESGSLIRKCPYDHWLTNKTYLSVTTVKKTFVRVFTFKMAAKIYWHRYGTKLRHCHLALLGHSTLCNDWNAVLLIVKITFLPLAGSGRVAAVERLDLHAAIILSSDILITLRHLVFLSAAVWSRREYSTRRPTRRD